MLNGNTKMAQRFRRATSLPGRCRLPRSTPGVDRPDPPSCMACTSDSRWRTSGSGHRPQPRHSRPHRRRSPPRRRNPRPRATRSRRCAPGGCTGGPSPGRCGRSRLLAHRGSTSTLPGRASRGLAAPRGRECYPLLHRSLAGPSFPLRHLPRHPDPVTDCCKRPRRRPDTKEPPSGFHRPCWS